MNKRTILLAAGLLDMVLGAGVLLAYFGVLPVDVESMGISRSLIGLIGGVWFVVAVAFVGYALRLEDE